MVETLLLFLVALSGWVSNFLIADLLKIDLVAGTLPHSNFLTILPRIGKMLLILKSSKASNLYVSPPDAKPV
jgi:hypothetical protein